MSASDRMSAFRDAQVSAISIMGGVSAVSSGMTREKIQETGEALLERLQKKFDSAETERESTFIAFEIGQIQKRLKDMKEELGTTVFMDLAFSYIASVSQGLSMAYPDF